MLKKEPLLPKCLLNASEDITYQFSDVRKLIPVPKGIEKETDDIYLLVIFVDCQIMTAVSRKYLPEIYQINYANLKVTLRFA